ncbi:glycoside hydrolase family 47 protein [Amniculicola lignicola CBS 123094]|uniref:alpha-1,2-Mannosidase n=1 Tax=Amniculicola lignicola CBS 123094 TaxID=1392246 RepID=A0A6A5WMC9_9PLEO|nr:glycoside hydrolase family 47 protein [Amniculicola lignicola CBS 123094]
MNKKLRIKPPRGGYQPMSRRHVRTLSYAFLFVSVFGLFYVFSRPTDSLAVPFEQHAAYMNDRRNVDNRFSKASYDWRKAPFHNRPASYKQLPKGKPKELPKIQYDFQEESRSRRKTREARRVAVRNEFKRNWASYKKLAWGMDELAPIAGRGISSFGGWGATLVDSLDTLWIMGLKDEFREAVEATAGIDFGGVVDEFGGAISVFETTIRYLGGLLSAYDLSNEKVLLDKAIQVGEMLYRAFDTQNNMPLDRLYIDVAKETTGNGFTSDSNICFAGIGSLTMEFVRLAQVTQDPKFYDAVARVTEFFDRVQNSTRIPGLFPIWVNAFNQDMSFDRTFSMGAMSDSSYEYFPKTFALLGGLEPAYEKLYRESAPLIDKYMLYRPMLPDPKVGEELLYCGEATAVSTQGDKPLLNSEMQHLTCFIGGFFGLAGKLFENKHHVDLGAKLTEGCIYAYKTMPTGVMPEVFNALPCPSRTECPWNQTLYEEKVMDNSYGKYGDDLETVMKELNIPVGFTALRDKRYLLRPEAIESVFVMYRITGHEEYLDHAWDMFQAVKKYSTTAFGNGQIVDVTDAQSGVTPEDKMESFWLAETLKYFYLIFSPHDMISLDEWVFNTEAHPFKRPKWEALVVQG